MLTSTDDTSEVEIENQIMARALTSGLMANERRVAQRDPRKLTTLERLVTYPDGAKKTTSLVCSGGDHPG